MRTSAGRARMRELSFERVPKARWLGTTWGLIGASSAGAIYTVAALAIGLGTNGARFGHDLVMAAFVSVGGLAGVLLGGVFGVMLPLPRQFFERRAVGATEPCPVAEAVEELAGTLAREGARVLVRSPTRESRREQGGAFRTAANRDLVPIGVLRLRVLGS